MKQTKLPQEFLLSRRDLAEIQGGTGYVCTCWNEDGTKTILPVDAASPEECAQMCIDYKEKESILLD